jgi:membrane fusion protein
LPFDLNNPRNKKEKGIIMLFRRQVLEAKKQTLTGRVVLIQPLSLYGISAALFALFVLILFYLSHFEFARKETVKGYLAPQKGVITLYFARSGVLNQLWVEEGLEITKGQPIARIQNSQGLTSGKERTTALLQEIDTQLKMLEKKRTISDALFNKQTLTLQHQLERLNQSLSAINKAKQTNTIRLDLQTQLYEKRQTLSQDGYLSATALIEAQEALLEYQEANQNR